MISYQYPLGERIRTLLRLEDLYDKVQYFSDRPEAYAHHSALLALFEILEVASRADLKSDLLQELERQKQTLEALRGNPAISEQALAKVLFDIETTMTQLLEVAGKVGQDLRDNEWLMSIKQRTSIPGGACEFDLPSYHYWLNQDAKQRRADLDRWLAPFLPIRNGIAIVLRILRDSGKTSQQIAAQGVFQQMMTGRQAQMLVIRLKRDYACVPEISANKYALNIRFVIQEGGQRARAAETDVPFDLTFCNL